VGSTKFEYVRAYVSERGGSNPGAPTKL